MIDRLLRLTWRKLLLIAIAWVACVVLHNAIYAQFRGYFEPDGDEPVFFLLAVVVLPLYFLAALGYTVVQKVRGT